MMKISSQYITICYMFSALLWLSTRFNMTCPPSKSSRFFSSGRTAPAQHFKFEMHRFRSLSLLHKVVMTLFGQSAEVIQGAENSKSQACKKCNQCPLNVGVAAGLWIFDIAAAAHWFGFSLLGFCGCSYCWRGLSRPKMHPGPERFCVISWVPQDTRINPCVRLGHVNDAQHKGHRASLA